jgi:hypothetical protein
VLPLSLALVYGLYLLAGLLIDDVPATVLVASILLGVINRDASLSAGTSAFWSLPGAYVFICVTNAVGLMGAFAYLLVEWVIRAPELALFVHLAGRNPASRDRPRS